jgi:hypothetical protein
MQCLFAKAAIFLSIGDAIATARPEMSQPPANMAMQKHAP